MIMKQYHHDELVDRIQNEPDSTFEGQSVSKQQILDDEDAIERLWILYQKAIEDYYCDEDWSYGNAMHEVYGVKVDGWEP